MLQKESITSTPGMVLNLTSLDKNLCLLDGAGVDQKAKKIIPRWVSSTEATMWSTKFATTWFSITLMIQMEMMGLNLSPLLTAVILAAVHFQRMQMVNSGTQEPNLMDTQLNTVKIPSGATNAKTGKMDTYIPVAGKKNGCKLIWPPWTKKYQPLLGVALVCLLQKVWYQMLKWQPKNPKLN